ncbi:MAG: DUF58 domain-containing protein [Bdellovibrionaceae bacterium]|nr:DUF58 domain-containing protein [Pseudobdellovibrionaceae bacterium]
MSLPAEVLKKVKLLELRTRKLVNNVFSGEYHSAFKGQGMTFSEFREYIPGDDVRTIAWPVTARTGTTFVKVFEEEREMTMMLAVDVSASTEFGTGEYFKGEVMSHLAALLGYAAMKNNDRVGLLLFSDQVEHYVPPKKGRGQVHRILRDLYFFQPKSKGTQLGAGLDHLTAVLKKRAHIFVFSDFLDRGYEHSLKKLGNKHDVACVVVKDKMETQFPAIGLVDLYDPETAEILTFDTSSKSFQESYLKLQKKNEKLRDQILLKSRMERIDVISGEDYVSPLVAFFKRRAHR